MPKPPASADEDAHAKSSFSESALPSSITEELVRTFPSKKAYLEELVEISKNDFKVMMKSINGIPKELDDKRAAEKSRKVAEQIAEQLIEQPSRKRYYELQRKCSIEFVLPDVAHDGRNHFLYETMNIQHNGGIYAKGYAYCADEDLYRNPIELDRTGLRRAITFNPIEGNWYYFVQKVAPAKEPKQK